MKFLALLTTLFIAHLGACHEPLDVDSMTQKERSELANKILKKRMDLNDEDFDSWLRKNNESITVVKIPSKKEEHDSGKKKLEQN